MAGLKSIVMVGHCGADQWSLRRTLDVLESEGVRLVTASSDEELGSYFRPECLWLVNRVLEGRFTAEDGVSLIASVAKRPNPPRLILISNYADAQKSAEAAGACPGFGKQQLGDPLVLHRIREAFKADGS